MEDAGAVLRECAAFHAKVAEEFEYAPSFSDDADAAVLAKQMTDVMRWRHKRYAEAIRAALTGLAASRELRK